MKTRLSTKNRTFITNTIITHRTQELCTGDPTVAYHSFQPDRSAATAAAVLRADGEAGRGHGQWGVHGVHGRVLGRAVRRRGGPDAPYPMHGQQAVHDGPRVRRADVAVAQRQAAGHDQPVLRGVHRDRTVAGVRAQGGRAVDSAAERVVRLRPDVRGPRDERAGPGPGQPHIAGRLQEDRQRERHVAAVPGAGAAGAGPSTRVRRAVLHAAVRQQHRDSMDETAAQKEEKRELARDDNGGTGIRFAVRKSVVQEQQFVGSHVAQQRRAPETSRGIRVVVVLTCREPRASRTNLGGVFMKNLRRSEFQNVFRNRNTFATPWLYNYAKLEQYEIT